MIENKIICSDVIDGLKMIEDNSVTLTITSPPYNVNIDYKSANDDLPYLKYLDWLESVFTENYRTLRNGGRLCINIDAMTNRQDDKEFEYIRDIRTDLSNRLKTIGFKFFGEHVWYKSNKDPSHNGGQFNGKKTAWGSYMSPSTPAVRRNHEYILVYSKGQFKLEKDQYSQPPDITDVEFCNYIASTWSMQPDTVKRGNHPVTFPMELPLRCIKLYSYPNDLILDPFNGSGTTTCAAKITGRRYLGIDMEKEYCEYAEDRLLAATNML